MENLSGLQTLCIEVFKSVSDATTVFILPLTMGRIVYTNSLGNGHKALETLKGLAVYFIATLAFPYLIDILFSIPESFLPKTQSLTNIGNQISETNILNVIPSTLDIITNVILSSLYWIGYYLHVFFMLLMCSMAPLVFMLGSILGIGIGIEIFMGLLVIGSSWPIIWFGFDQVHAMLMQQQDDSFGSKCLEIIVTLFKGLGPLTFAGLAIKSPAGKAVSTAAQAAIGGIKGVALTTAGKSLAYTSLVSHQSNHNNLGFKLQPKADPSKWAYDKLKTERAEKIEAERLERAKKEWESCTFTN